MGELPLGLDVPSSETDRIAVVLGVPVWADDAPWAAVLVEHQSQHLLSLFRNGFVVFE